MNTSSDQRRYRRIPEAVAVEVKTIAFPIRDEAPVAATGKNISAGGICFTVHRAYDVGELLNLRIRLAGWQHHKRSYAALIDDDVALAPLTAVGRVAWCRPRPGEPDHDIGVLFENIYEDDFRALEKYLAFSDITDLSPLE